MSTNRKLAAKELDRAQTMYSNQIGLHNMKKMATFLHGVFQSRKTISSEVNIMYLAIIYVLF